MILESISSLRTDPGLLRAVQSASKPLTPHEVMEQRVSFAYGSMGRDSDVTKEQVRQFVIAQGGATEVK